MKTTMELLGKNSRVSDYKINISRKESYELFFVKGKLETLRCTDTCDKEVTVYSDHDGFRGDAQFFVYPSTTKEDATQMVNSVAIYDNNGNFLRRGKICRLHPALIGTGNVRNEHCAVTHNLGVAAEAPAGFIFLVGDMPGGDALHLTCNKLHTALAAGAVTGAGCVDGNIAPTGQLQKIITGVTFQFNRASALDLKNYFHTLWFLICVLSHRVSGVIHLMSSPESSASHKRIFPSRSLPPARIPL